MTSERRFGPSDSEFAIIAMGVEFTGRRFQMNERGLREVTVLLEAQHEKVMPPVPDKARLFEVVAQEMPIVRLTEQMFAESLGAEDWESALFTSNHLFAYGDADFKDNLGGEAFTLSLKSHRQLLDTIRRKFSGHDPFLRMQSRKMFEEIEDLRSQGNFQRELEVMRGMIHMVALNGTLGSRAKTKFDPFALVGRQL